MSDLLRDKDALRLRLEQAKRDEETERLRQQEREAEHRRRLDQLAALEMAFRCVVEFPYPEVVNGKPVPPQTGPESCYVVREIAGVDDVRWDDWGASFRALASALESPEFGHYREVLEALPLDAIAATYFFKDHTIEQASAARAYALELFSLASGNDREHLRLALAGGRNVIGPAFWLVKAGCLELLKRALLKPSAERLIADIAPRLDGQKNMDLFQEVVTAMPWLLDKANDHPPPPEESQAEEGSSPINQPDAPHVDEEDLFILRALNRLAPRLQTQSDLEVESRVSRRTIQTRIGRLLSAKLIERPKGLRSGMGITAAGKEFLAKIDRAKPAQ